MAKRKTTIKEPTGEVAEAKPKSSRKRAAAVADTPAPKAKRVRAAAKKKVAGSAKAPARARKAVAEGEEAEYAPAGTTSLVIVESPAKARTIGKYLGRGYRVKATVGHVRDLPQKKLGIDVYKGFTPQ